jgi:ABC-type phosphate transport system substrate-binding protein
MRSALARAITLALVLWPVAERVAGADAFVVIVHPSVTGSSIRRADLGGLFLKKVSRWGSGGGLAVPVDQSGTSPVRSAFSEGVLRQPVAQVVQYWQKQMFSAARLAPPPVKASDAEVIEFVAKNPGSVGYVASGTPLPPDVKTLTLID